MSELESKVKYLDDIKRKRKAVPGGYPKINRLIINWVHQGLLYMDKSEKLFKISVEVAEFSLISFLLIYIEDFSLNIPEALIISFVIVHTFNWTTNNLFWSVVMFSFPNMRNPGRHKTLLYLRGMRNRLRTNRSISALALYGSISRQRWHCQSDIDVRILRRPGFLNAIIANFIISRERFIAFIKLQPTDIFLADNVEFLKKMRSDEAPIFLIQRDKSLEALYETPQESKVSELTLGDPSK